MMATTELSKIPETVLSRSQVFEFKTISSKQIADQLRRIADAEKIAVDDSALLLVARSAEGSMRDAQSAFDQVIAFAGQQVSVDDVATVLGLVGRDLVLDIVAAVAEETPAAAFELTGRAVELGYDLRSVIRELSRVVRDLLVLSVDPSRIDDPEIASEGERQRLEGLASRFSREDLLRAFDVLAKADAEIRNASQPRYHLEMALLRWIHLRKLVPLTELLGGVGSGGFAKAGGFSKAGGSTEQDPPYVRSSTNDPSNARSSANIRRPGPPDPASVRGAAPEDAAPEGARNQDPPFVRKAAPLVPPVERRMPAAKPDARSPEARAGEPVGTGEAGRDAFLLEIRRSKVAFYNTVVAQAQKIEFGPERVTFAFLPQHRLLREQLEQNRQWLEQTAAAVAGKKMLVVAAQAESVHEPAPAGAPPAGTPPKPADLKTSAMADTAVQAMLDVFPAEIENVEEIE
jgi:DNA polymerase-3 subunit gamma/tau